MTKFLLIVVFATAAFAENGFVKLFNGKNLDGWDGDHIQVKLNGTVTADIHDSASLKGVIAFQLHRGPAMEAYFRNVEIKVLK
jgi:hypothetical protein